MPITKSEARTRRMILKFPILLIGRLVMEGVMV
jgi:hypothetical protein